MNRRIVPAIWGILTLAAAGYVLTRHWGLWKYIPSIALLAFGWVSVKTAIQASDQEIDELTGQAPISEATRKNVADRL